MSEQLCLTCMGYEHQSKEMKTIDNQGPFLTQQLKSCRFFVRVNDGGPGNPEILISRLNMYGIWLTG